LEESRAFNHSIAFNAVFASFSHVLTSWGPPGPVSDPVERSAAPGAGFPSRPAGTKETNAAVS
jgi:hypothetical protein